ncbi:hypothetical protein DYB36_011432 [Aphanomyces astaci]|uniref:FH2 domain-containing protein n=1 Tax=Aphanomyces astaci TaxID=112090 RepID=A0A397BPI4_APHAT|nr:hypothetical protein DYB36_011432 [Aphanomyces astaci]
MQADFNACVTWFGEDPDAAGMGPDSFFSIFLSFAQMLQAADRDNERKRIAEERRIRREAETKKRMDMLASSKQQQKQQKGLEFSSLKAGDAQDIVKKIRGKRSEEKRKELADHEHMSNQNSDSFCSSSSGIDKKKTTRVPPSIPEAHGDHLWSRDAAGMAATTADVTAAWQRQVWVRARVIDQAHMIHLYCTQTSHSIHVTQTVVDLSDDSTYGPAIDTFVEEAQAAASVDRVVVVHNAGSLGQVGRIAEVASPQVIRRHMELNVNSVLWINKRQDQMSILRLTIVYISRLLQVYGTQAQAAKAARDMHFRVVATEEDATRVKCLNYAPGPMQTEMGNEGTYVDVNVSAQLCVSHVFGPTLVSGTHVDYYDIYQG